MRRCGVCGEEMRGTTSAGIWTPDEEVAEVFNPNDMHDTVTCHVGCIPAGWEVA